MKFKVTLRFVKLDLCNDDRILTYVHYYDSLSDLNQFFVDYYCGKIRVLDNDVPWMLNSIIFERSDRNV